MIIIGNSGRYLLPYWKVVCEDRNDSGEITTVNRATNRSSPTPNSGATSLHLIGDCLMYIETSANKKGQNVFLHFRTNRYYSKYEYHILLK